MRVSTPVKQREDSHPRAGSQSEVRVSGADEMSFMCNQLLTDVFIITHINKSKTKHITNTEIQ